MTDKIKYFAKLSATAVASFLKIILLGNISGAVTLTIGLSLVIYQTYFHGPHLSGQTALLIMFMMAPVQMILLVLLITATYFIIPFAGKYTIKKIINKIIADKSESTLYPILDKVLHKFKMSPKTTLIQKGMDYSLVKLQLIENVKQETENKWIKKVLIYGFKKLKMDDIDFSQQHLESTEILKQKTIQALQNVAKPSKKFFWMVIGLQWLVVLIILLMR
jgi:hypothetical protein